MRWNVVREESRRRLVAPVEELAIWLPETTLGWLLSPVVVVVALVLALIALFMGGGAILYLLGVEDLQEGDQEVPGGVWLATGVGGVMVVWLTSVFVLPLLKEWSDWRYEKRRLMDKRDEDYQLAVWRLQRKRNGLPTDQDEDWY